MACPLCGETCNCVRDVGSQTIAFGGPLSPLGPSDGDASGIVSFDLQSSSAFVRDGAPKHIVASEQPKFIVSDNDIPWSARETSALHDDAIAGSNESAPPLSQPDSADPQNPDSFSDGTASDLDSWRDEVSARLNRYRARRRPRPPRYPSLRLKFEQPSVRTPTAALSSETPAEQSLAPSPAPLTCQALAMSPAVPLEVSEPETVVLPDTTVESAPTPQEAASAPSVLGKILEFPRWAYEPPVQLHELADPVMDRPRILEVPEVLPPPPAMGGITIEDARPVEPERRPGIDMPLQAAPLGLRTWAVVVDVIVVLLATSLFGLIFYRITATKPPFWELLGLGIGLPCIFWAAYQYLFLVYCGTTLGLQAAHLRLSRFDGTPVNQRRRRLRVLCSFLSGLSLGMGYAWQFLDEDRLCWHERVTRTYLGPRA